MCKKKGRAWHSDPDHGSAGTTTQKLRDLNIARSLYYTPRPDPRQGVASRDGRNLERGGYLPNLQFRSINTKNYIAGSVESIIERYVTMLIYFHFQWGRWGVVPLSSTVQ